MMKPLATALTALVGATALGVLGIQVAQAGSSDQTTERGSEPAYVKRDDDANELGLADDDRDDDNTRDNTRDNNTRDNNTRDNTAQKAPRAEVADDNTRDNTRDNNTRDNTRDNNTRDNNTRDNTN